MTDNKRDIAIADLDMARRNLSFYVAEMATAAEKLVRAHAELERQRINLDQIMKVKK